MRGFHETCAASSLLSLSLSFPLSICCSYLANPFFFALLFNLPHCFRCASDNTPCLFISPLSVSSSTSPAPLVVLSECQERTERMCEGEGPMRKLLVWIALLRERERKGGLSSHSDTLRSPKANCFSSSTRLRCTEFPFFALQSVRAPSSPISLLHLQCRPSKVCSPLPHPLAFTKRMRERWKGVRQARGLLTHKLWCDAVA